MLIILTSIAVFFITRAVVMFFLEDTEPEPMLDYHPYEDVIAGTLPLDAYLTHYEGWKYRDLP